MNSTTAFVSAAPVLGRASSALASSSLTPRRTPIATPTRRAALAMSMDDIEKKATVPSLPKIPQGFTAFSEELNGRAAMIGFVLGLTTEVITGKGIIGQVASIFDIVNQASALGN